MVSTNAHASQRLAFVDAQRGLAVVFMLWMHTGDGWLRPELKHTWGYAVIRSLGGLAAPMFLLLVGVSLGLAWGRAGTATEAERAAAQRTELARGLQIVLLGYALRLQMWMLDGGGFQLADGWLCALPLAAAYAGGYAALGAYARGASRSALGLLAGATGAALVGLTLVVQLIPERMGSLLRVDVLQAIGVSIALLALLRTPLARAPWLGVLLGVAVALLTPAMRAWVPGPLPAALAGYLAHWDAPPGRPSPTLFPLFPWAAYALIGTAAGALLAAAEHRRQLGRAMVWLSAGAAALALLACEPLPSGHSIVAAWPGLTPAVRVIYRIGVALVLGGLCFWLCEQRTRASTLLVTLGRASLFVYWVHLQFAFGTVAKPISKQLDFGAWAIGLCALTAAMTLLAIGWVRFRTTLMAGGRRAKPLRGARSEPASLTNA